MTSLQYAVNSTIDKPESTKESLESIKQKLQHHSFYFMPAANFREYLLHKNAHALDDKSSFIQSWHDLHLDSFMGDNGKYRTRRYSTLSYDEQVGNWVKEADQPHYQGRDYNALNGGIPRYFSPVAESILYGNTMSNIIKFGCDLFSAIEKNKKWHIEVHQFRISAKSTEAGKPTPEGVHRDGVDYVLMIMVKRKNIKNGQTTIYDLNKHPLTTFTLSDTFDVAIVNDHNVYHGVSNIEPLDHNDVAYRDIFVVTYRKK